MPNIKSAMKRVKVSEKQNLRNRMIRTNIKTTMKNFDQAIAAGDVKLAKELYPSTVGVVDGAVVKGILHKNTAARKKVQLARKLNSIAQG